MPVFRAQRSQRKSIADALAAALTSSPELSGQDYMKAAVARSQIEHHSSLAEKARQEIERQRRTDAEMRDPGLHNDFAAMSSGLTRQQGQGVHDAFIGRDFQKESLVTHDDEGNVMPPAVAVRPEGISDAQAARYSSFRAPLTGNLATGGRSNIEQVTKAGTSIALDRARAAAAELPTADAQNLAMNPYRPTPLLPFVQNASGDSVLNRSSGAATTPDTPAANTAIGRAVAQTREREAAVVLARTRAADIQATQPGRVELLDARTDAANNPRPRSAPARTEAQEGRDRAYAEQQAERTAKLRRENQGESQREASARFRGDPQMKGRRLGRWVNGKGFEVTDPAGKLVGYYD